MNTRAAIRNVSARHQYRGAKPKLRLMMLADSDSTVKSTGQKYFTREKDMGPHRAKLQQAVLEVVAGDGGALVDDRAVADVDHVQVAHVQRVDEHVLADARALCQWQSCLSNVVRFHTAIATLKVQ